jgi:hypothetical protein
MVLDFIRPRKEQRVKSGSSAKGAKCSAWLNDFFQQPATELHVKMRARKTNELVSRKYHET